MKEKDIPAFHCDEYSLDEKTEATIIYQHKGMTMRDYFAAKAMQGMYSNDAEGYDFKGVAKAAYLTADAMLAERKKP